MKQSILLVFLLYLTALIISFFFTMNTGFIGGELIVFYFKDGVQVFWVFLLVLLSFVAAILVYTFMKSYRFIIGKNFEVVYYNNRFDFFTFIVLSASVYFVSMTGVGRLLSEATHPLSFVFNTVNPDYFFYIYYVLRRERSGLLFWLNFFLFIFLNISKGWTGFLLVLFFLEVYFFYKNKPLKISFFAMAPCLIAFILIVGGSVYSFLAPLKNEIRGLGGEPMSVMDGINSLSQRLSNYSISLGGYQESVVIVKKFNDQDMPLKELTALFRPIIPSFIFTNKESFTTLNNDVLKPFYPDITNKTSSDVSLFVYLYILLEANPLQLISYLLISVFILLLVKFILDTISLHTGQFDFLFFLYVFSFFYTSQHEVVSTGYIGFSLFILPLLFILGILRFKVRHDVHRGLT